MGICPLYWARWQGQILVASSPQGLIDHLGLPRRLNLEYLARTAVPGAIYFDPDNSCYAGVKAVPAGSVLRFEEGVERVTPYWRPNPEARLRIPDYEIPEVLRELLFKAVAARLPRQGTAVALLSGGLDSSSLVAVAATLLKQQNRELLTLSAVNPPGSGNPHPDEQPFIDTFATWDNIRIEKIAAAGRGPFDALETLSREADSPWVSSRHYLYGAFAEALQAAGADSLLDGVGGEMGPSGYAEQYYPELFLSGQWCRLYSSLRERAARENLPLRVVTRRKLVKPFLHSSWLRALGQGRADLKHQSDNAVYHPSFLSRYVGSDFKHLVARYEQRMSAPWDHRRHSALGISIFQGLCLRAGWFEGHSSLRFEFPFLDRRVLEFCLAAPADRKIRRGYTRYLIRAAMDGLLPPAIQWRTSKEPFSPDYQLRYNHQRPMAVALLDGISPSDPVREIVDVESLRRMASQDMETNRSNSARDFVAMHQVPFGLYLIAFLRQFPEFRA